MKPNWHKLVLQNFDTASYKYNNGAFLQKVFAKKLAEECKKRDESVTHNLILTGFKICKSCRVSKTIFPI